jgi:peptidylamidoglycolate lyase
MRSWNHWHDLPIAEIACILAVAVSQAAAQPPAADAGKSRGPYQVVAGWPALPPGQTLGAVAGVGVDSHDNVFVFHRAGRDWPASGVLDLKPIAEPTVALFDGRSGALLAEWGAKTFAMPHGLTVDKDDNIWLTDVALQQVYKYSHDGKLLLTLGKRGIAGNDRTHFNRPTDVAAATDGSFYVSDGYRNTRVLKFAVDGSFLFQWGTKGSGPGQFDLPHGIALGAEGRVYVADRSNARVQVFDGKGQFLTQWSGPALGRPYDVVIGSNGVAFVADGGDQDPRSPGRSAVAIVSLDGNVLQRVGEFGTGAGQFSMAHAVAAAKDGSVYVADTGGKRVQKFVPTSQ